MQEIFVVYILHPKIKIKLKYDEYFLKLRNNKEIILFFYDSRVKLIDWYYAPKFGALIKTKCLHVMPNREVIKTSISWNKN